MQQIKHASTSSESSKVEFKTDRGLFIIAKGAVKPKAERPPAKGWCRPWSKWKSKIKNGLAGLQRKVR